jgi:hypothetical protein
MLSLRGSAPFRMSYPDGTVRAVEAVTWTVVGMLGAALFASFGGFFFLSGRIDFLSGRIDALGAELGGRIDALGAELGRGIDSQTARLDSRLDSQEVRLGRLSDQMAELAATVQAHLARHTG